MKNNKLIIFSIIASVIIVAGAIFVYFIFNPQSLSSSDNDSNSSIVNDNTEIQEETEDLTDENLASNVEQEQGNGTVEQRSLEELESGFISEVQSVINQYINGRYAPMNEEEYNEAISMHSQEIIDNNDFDYENQFENSYALNEEKDIEDIIVDVDMVSDEVVTGSYSFTLIVELSNSVEEIEHEGEFTLSTYENGYLYISEFGDTNE